MSRSVWVYAHWHSMEQPELVGILEVDLVRDAEVYRFAYAESWLSSPFAVQIDPQLKLFSGDQYHGFILADNASSGWLLSPAYDINVIQGATGLHLNIDDYSNELSLDLALEVAPYFQLSVTQSKEILTELRSVTDNWQQYANEIGINRQEQQLPELILF